MRKSLFAVAVAMLALFGTAASAAARIASTGCCPLCR